MDEMRKIEIEWADRWADEARDEDNALERLSRRRWCNLLAQ